MWRSLEKWLAGWLSWSPHFVVGPPDNPYLCRWYILPRNPWCNVYLHHFLQSDDARALHDHPWWSVSLCLRGSYVEVTEGMIPAGRWGLAMPPVPVVRLLRRLVTCGSIVFRKATHKHRIELPDGKSCWTLFITGPRVREWGFHCPKGWVPWYQFVKPTAHGQIGRGCEQ